MDSSFGKRWRTIPRLSSSRRYSRKMSSVTRAFTLGAKIRWEEDLAIGSVVRPSDENRENPQMCNLLPVWSVDWRSSSGNCRPGMTLVLGRSGRTMSRTSPCWVVSPKESNLAILDIRIRFQKKKQKDILWITPRSRVIKIMWSKVNIVSGK